MRQSLADAIAGIPADQRGRATVDVSLRGVELNVGHRFNRIWSVGAYGAYDWSGDRELGARVQATW